MSIDDENFANYPESLAERKSTKEENGSLWTPRDALINVLRDIDNGEYIPTKIAICMSTERDEKIVLKQRFAGGNRLETLGLLLQVILDYQ